MVASVNRTERMVKQIAAFGPFGTGTPPPADSRPGPPTRPPEAMRGPRAVTQDTDPPRRYRPWRRPWHPSQTAASAPSRVAALGVAYQDCCARPGEGGQRAITVPRGRVR